mgnify:CR=1 FL=1
MQSSNFFSSFTKNDFRGHFFELGKIENSHLSRPTEIKKTLYRRQNFHASYLNKKAERRF